MICNSFKNGTVIWTSQHYEVNQSTLFSLYRPWYILQLCFVPHNVLQRVRLANRGRLLLRTPGPVPFGTCICSNVETILSWTCHVYGHFEIRTSLGTSILLQSHISTCTCLGVFEYNLFRKFFFFFFFFFFWGGEGVNWVYKRIWLSVYHDNCNWQLSVDFLLYKITIKQQDNYKLHQLSIME